MRDKVGRYKILRRLGHGAMGVVYLAEDPLLNRQVAIKMVDLSVEESSQRDFLRQRLLRDAKAAAMLAHPNIVAVYDVIEEDEAAYVVMEYIAGESLASYLQKQPRPDTAFSLRVLRQMAAALDFSHSKGIIHRDVKPGNAMLEADGTAKILDFGIARLSGGQTATATGVVMGTVEYMAPEQIKGDAVDGRADQFSLAAVAYQMMTGSTLFGPQTLPALTYKMVHETPPPARTRNISVPPPVDAVLTRGLAKAPSERYATCAELIAALDHAFTGADTEATRLLPQPATLPQPTRPGRPGVRLWLAAGLGALILMGGVWMTWRTWRTVGQNAASPPPEPVISRSAEPPPQAAKSIPSAEPPHEAAQSVRPSEPQRQQPARSEPPAQTARTIPAESSRNSQPQARVTQPEPVQQPPQQEPDNGPQHPAMQIYHQGQDQLKAGNYVAAIQSFTKAISLRPRYAPAYYSRGSAHQLLEQNEAAVKDYSDAIRLAPNDVLAYSGRGTCLVRLRRDEEAFADFNRALELRPGSARALNGRGGVYLRRKQFKLAINDFTAAIADNPQLAQAYNNRARAKRAIGDLAGAEADLKAEEQVKKQKNQAPDKE